MTATSIYVFLHIGVFSGHSAVIPIDDLPGPQHIPNQVNLHQLCVRVEEANMVLFFLWYYQSSTGFSYAILWRHQPAVCRITLVVDAKDSHDGVV
jgi:hypothetical protein